ncbi:hypothetical protein AMK16_33025 [Streptomyces sp. CB00455]|uniref:hypothetical protein n=1 Tax=Streptomyces sp. CB00455 TaxID=1703927 RepID=UPI00093A845B|nr:hypothetical protein [Streptomyces sp. CB00455]OKK11127.1 hypothetical protein AMK16_33025 [Streptomyces sp. CB00455]
MSAAGTPEPCTELEVVGERTDAAAPPWQTAVVRLLAALPARWQCRPVAEEHRVSIRIRAAGSAPAEARSQLGEVLAEPALRGWRWRY